MSEDDKRKNSEAQAVVELLKIVEPITSAVKDGPMGVARLLDEAGVSKELLGRDASTLLDTIGSDVTENAESIDKAVSSIVSEVDGVTDIEGLHEIDEVDWAVVFAELDYTDVLENVKSVVGSVKSIFETIETLQQIELQDPDLPSLGDQVFDFLLIRYLKGYHGQVYGYLRIFGVITDRKGRSGPEDLRLDKLADAFEDPNQIPTELFQWAKSNQPFLASLLLQELLNMSWGKHLPTAIIGADGEEREQLTGVDDLEKVDDSAMDQWGQKLQIPLLGAVYQDTSRAETGLQVVPLPPAEDDDFLPGLALVTYGTITSDMSAKLGEDWKVTVDGDGELANRGVAINPSLDDGLNFSFVNTEGSSGSTPGGQSEDQLVFEIELKHVGDAEKARKEVLGTLIGGITIDGMAVGATFEYANDEFTFGVEFTTTGILSIDPQGGFLDKVIPKPIEYDFEITLGWSTEEGFYLQNGGTLFVSLADNIPLGPLTIKETALGLDLGELTGGQDGGDGGSSPPALPVSFASTPKLDIGFMTAEVTRTGVKADLSFPGGTEGNLGPADLDIGFKPPQGLSLSVDAGPVTGGGMLGFYPDEHRYSGALQLSVGSLSLSAIGLLKTRLPGGKDGYSFLLLITAEFPPVQLGFGFTLNGVGGLLGLHRGMKTKVLGRKVRSGNVDSVLFPQNVVENSQQIISDLRAIFPPKQDVHVVGPMVKMGWGTPTMLTMEVGVVLELPTFEIAIVGAFHLNLPDEEAPLVTINLAVLGVLDIPDERLAVTASLYDSRIVMWTVSGDMAMRLRWGDDSTFMLSVGGFHPRYDPPKGFPELDRVKASLGAPSGNPSLELKGYLATTPNTFQVGAGVYLKAEAGPARVTGELSFDALFQFDPFKFVIDFLAKLSVTIKGKGLSIRVDGTLSGPGPMRVTGTVHIEILFITVTANVDVTLGSGGKEEKLPRARVMPELTTELGKPGNWAAQVPDSAESLVSIRDHRSSEGEGEQAGDGSGGEDRLLTHPLGGVAVRQTVVPLRDRIEKFGNMVPRDYEEFRITELRVDGEDLATEPTREKFAPAKFKQMSDGEKMNSPSFVTRTAGREAGSGLVYFPGNTEDTADRAAELRRTAKLEYETSVVDERRETHAAPLDRLGGFAVQRPEVARFGVPLEKVPLVLEDGALARAELREDFTGGTPEVYGVPGGTVIGTREDRVLPEDSVTVMPGDDVSGIDERFADGEGSLLGGQELTDPERGGVINVGGNR